MDLATVSSSYGNQTDTNTFQPRVMANPNKRARTGSYYADSPHLIPPARPSLSSPSDKSPSEFAAPAAPAYTPPQDDPRTSSPRRTPQHNVLDTTNITLSWDKTKGGSNLQEQACAVQGVGYTHPYSASTVTDLTPQQQTERQAQQQAQQQARQLAAQQLQVQQRQAQQASSLQILQQKSYEQVEHAQMIPKEESQIVTNMVIQRLLAHLATFESKDSLDKLVKDAMADAMPIQEFYRIGNHPMVYTGQPTWNLSLDGLGKAELKGNQPIGDLGRHLAFNRHLPFVALRTYDPSPPLDEFRPEQQSSSADVYQELSPSDDSSSNSSSSPSDFVSNLQTFDDDTKPTIISQEIIPASPAMIDALIHFFRNFAYLKVEDDVVHNFSWWLDETGILKAPFVFWYHARSFHAWNRLSRTGQMLIEQLRSWIYLRYGEEFARVDTLLDRGVITLSYINYLAVPGEPWIAETKDKHVYGCIITDWISPRHQEAHHRARRRRGKAEPISWRIPAWHYKYCGYFYKYHREIEIDAANYDLRKEIELQDLRPVPMRYAAASLIEKLKKRGELFWRFRNRQLVSYNGETGNGGDTATDRYMIDFEIYLQLHPDSNIATSARSSANSIKAMSRSQSTSDSPPTAPELYLFPPQIIGYNLRTKKWYLDVDRMEEVEWNKKAFDYLVLNPDMKELVLALVTNKLAADRGADLIENKGKGLILLLHGGPGTGKTLTAESVAEIAEKPLFRVTCADVGIQPEAVEKYLDSVFRFAKRWDCVVLLDEADVFLEKRTLDDLSRNALVTVFLRVLEYYEGILILTSNRVGTFDEAFKSRIQLSLHYEPLRKPQRIKIWKNFMDQLKSIENVKIDFVDVESYIDELADHELNGRQIRNSITTARQLAQYKEVPVNHAHLKHVIEVASKFDTYIQKVQDGYTDEQIARQDGLR